MSESCNAAVHVLARISYVRCWQELDVSQTSIPSVRLRHLQSVCRDYVFLLLQFEVCLSYISFTKAIKAIAQISLTYFVLFCGNSSSAQQA